MCCLLYEVYRDPLSLYVYTETNVLHECIVQCVDHLELCWRARVTRQSRSPPAQIPLRSIMLRMPCWPVRISLRKLSSATHTMGAMSSPLKGLTTLRVGASSGSASRQGGEGRAAHSCTQQTIILICS